MTPSLPRRRAVLALAGAIVVAAAATACGTGDTSATKATSGAAQGEVCKLKLLVTGLVCVGIGMLVLVAGW